MTTKMTTGSGTPSTMIALMPMKLSGTRIELSPAITCARPRKKISVPMVTMIEGSCMRIVMKALSAPIARPANRPTRTASGRGTPASCTQANIQAERAMFEAAERSISPEMTTIVSTSATMDISAVRVKLRRM